MFGACFLLFRDLNSALLQSHFIFSLNYTKLNSPRNPFIAFSVAFAEWAVLKPFVTAQSAACAFPCQCLRRTSALKTNTRTTVQFAAKTCFLRVSRPKTCPVDTRFTRTASVSSRDLITAALFVRKQWSVSKAWRRLGKPAPVTLPTTPCRMTCSAS